jgi:hypothetical protein
MEITCTSLLDDLRASVHETARRGSSVAAQCTLAAAAEAVEQALTHEAQAGSAALSLAQRDTLAALGEELRAAGCLLRSALDAHHRERPSPAVLPRSMEERFASLRRILDRSPSRPAPPSWWSALSQAIDGIGACAGRLDRLAGGQPEEAPSRAVAEATARLLRSHHQLLLGSAERWLP